MLYDPSVIGVQNRSVADNVKRVVHTSSVAAIPSQNLKMVEYFLERIGVMMQVKLGLLWFRKIGGRKNRSRLGER